MVLVSLGLLIFVASSPSPEDEIGGIIGSRGYDLISWEVNNFLDKWFHEAANLFGGGDRSKAEELSVVEEYFSLSRTIASAEQGISRAVAKGEGNLEALLSDQEELERKRNALRDDVEEIIEEQVSAVLSGQGLSWKLPIIDTDGYLFPPVDFRFDDSPRLLVVSPRNKIKLLETTLLKPNLALKDTEEIERGVEGSGDISSLVTGTGGIATYPSVVPPSTSLRDTLRNVAHEWVHHYMIFFPLGRNYWANDDMITVNETIADIIGKQVGDQVFEIYYAGQLSDETLAPQETATAFADNDFDFNREMRGTRLRVDELLAEGRVEEAERYMEKQRLFLAENGYFLRRLNQAYFAFHGTYADRPTSVSPIGEQVREIRLRSTSLKDFIKKVSGASSYNEFLSLLEVD